MDEKDFKKHLKDLAHGHHHPEEHDWATGTGVKAVKATKAKRATTAKRATAHKPASKRRKK